MPALWKFLTFWFCSEMQAICMPVINVYPQRFKKTIKKKGGPWIVYSLKAQWFFLSYLEVSFLPPYFENIYSSTYFCQRVLEIMVSFAFENTLNCLSHQQLFEVDALSISNLSWFFNWSLTQLQDNLWFLSFTQIH